MIDTFFNHYYKNNIIRGYQIFDKKLVNKSLFIISMLLLLWILLLYKSEVWVLLIFSRLFLVMAETNKEMDIIFKQHIIDSSHRTKNNVSIYLKTIFKFNHSSQYKEIAILFKEKGTKGLKSYNLLPYLSMVLTILLFLGNKILEINSNSLKDVIILISIVGGIFLITNTLVNTIANFFLNGKPSVMINLSDTLYELYFDESIKENTLNSYENLNTNKPVKSKNKIKNL